MKQVDPQPRWPEHLPPQVRERDPVTVFLESPAISAIRRDAQPLSERDYCEHVIAFANDGGLPVEAWFELLGGAQASDDEAVTNRAPRGRIVEGSVMLVRDQLRQLVQHRQNASRHLGPWWADFTAQHGVVSLPICVFGDDGTMRLEHRIVVRDLLAGIGYGMCLLLAQDRPHGAELCRCRLESCGRFFFEKKRPGAGRPRREYCSDEHLVEAHRQQVLQRVRRHRAKQKRGRKSK